MEPTGPTLLLLARLLILGADGTHALSEHRARIPAGATGLLRETLHETNLPGAVALHVTPRPRPDPSPSVTEPQGIFLSLREELWGDARAEAAGRPADEINSETVELIAGASTLVQLAEDAAAGRRLILSLRMLPAEAEEPAFPAPPSAREVREVAFRVDAYRDVAGARDLLSTHLLRTLEGLPVSCQSSWRALRAAGDGSPGPPEEVLSLTLRPLSHQEGWISVEAALIARLLPPPGGTEPILLNTTATRTVAMGLPFEFALPLPPGSAANVSPPTPGETFVVQITPYVPSHPVPIP